MDWIKDNYPELINNPVIRSILIIFASMIIAKITDLVFTGIIKRLTSKTRTEFDDKIVVLFHKPIFYSILFIGFSMAVKTANLPEYIDYALVGLFKTITIIIWLFLVSKILIIVIEWASRQTKTNKKTKTTTKTQKQNKTKKHNKQNKTNKTQQNKQHKQKQTKTNKTKQQTKKQKT